MNKMKENEFTRLDCARARATYELEGKKAVLVRSLAALRAELDKLEKMAETATTECDYNALAATARGDFSALYHLTRLQNAALECSLLQVQLDTLDSIAKDA
jgi:hypothetical protein